MSRVRLRFGDIVKVGRTLRGWTLRDLGRESGVVFTLVHKIETGAVENPTIDTVRRLADAFGCSPGTLLDRCEIGGAATPTKGRRE